METGLAVASDSASPSIFEAESRSGNAMGGFAIFLIGGALSAAGGILLENKTVVFAGILTMFIGMFLIAYSSFLPARRKRYISTAPATRDMPQDDGPAFRAETTRRLVQPAAAVNDIPSVTEDTTDLLKVPANSDPRGTGL